MSRFNKIIVILGPTSSGKSEVAIRLAKKFDGEIISADSRQIYKGLDIGTGKVRKDKSKIKNPACQSLALAGRQRSKVFYSEGIVHHMLDIVSPNTEYNVAKFKKAVDKIIPDILRRGKVPIICGGTGFWIKAIVDNVNFPEVKPDWKLRNKLRNKSAEVLFKMLKKLDPQRAKNIDSKNKVRLIRAIEICKSIGKVPKKATRDKRQETEDFLQIGIKIEKEKLYSNIKKRLQKRFEAGMIREVKNLHFNPPAGGKLSWKKIQSFGLGYYWIPLFLKGKLSKKDVFEKVFQAEKGYAQRQMTWFQKDNRIKWIRNYKNIEKEVKKFLT